MQFILSLPLNKFVLCVRMTSCTANRKHPHQNHIFGSLVYTVALTQLYNHEPSYSR